MKSVIAAFIIGALIFTAAFGLVLAGLAWLSRRSIGRAVRLPKEPARG